VMWKTAWDITSAIGESTVNIKGLLYVVAEVEVDEIVIRPTAQDF
jgi:hypothetical protein